MKPTSTQWLRIVGFVVAAGLGVVACSDQTSTSLQNPALTRAQADSLGDAIVADVQGELDVATATGVNPFVFGTSPSASSLGCLPTITPQPPVNSDGDRVPDSLRFEWDNCVLTFERGSDTIRGTIDIIDPTPNTTDRAIKQVFTDFAHIFVDLAGRLRSITRNGSRSIVADASHIALNATGFRVDLVFRDGTTASHVRNWDALFTADVPNSILPDSRLPSGTLTIDGASTWTRGGNTFALDVSTPTPLHYDASCGLRPKFDAGQLVVVATRNGTTSTVTIDFTGCGQYTVTRS